MTSERLSHHNNDLAAFEGWKIDPVGDHLDGSDYLEFGTLGSELFLGPWSRATLWVVDSANAGGTFHVKVEGAIIGFDDQVVTLVDADFNADGTRQEILGSGAEGAVVDGIMLLRVEVTAVPAGSSLVAELGVKT